MPTAIKRIVILKEISESLKRSAQWMKMKPEWLDRSSKYLIKAESLIEILEVKDCGSIGGFDQANQLPGRREGSYDLCERFLLLTRKHKDEKKIGKETMDFIMGLKQKLDAISE